MILERQQVARLGIVRQTLLRIAFDGDVAFKKSRVDLAAEFAHRPAFGSGHSHVEVAFGGSIDSADDLFVVGPRDGLDDRREFF